MSNDTITTATMKTVTTSITTPYPSAIGFAIASFIVSILTLPALHWHITHANVGATAITFLALLANLSSSINATVWPHDDLARFRSGVIYCDVQAKLQPIMQTAFPVALFCVLRGLAVVLDPQRQSWDAAIRRKCDVCTRFMELLLCTGLPTMQAIAAWIVQPIRYYVFSISGCEAATDGSWLAALLLIGPRLIWTVVDVWYAVLIIHRLRLHRRSLAALLSAAHTSASRFARLYALCLCSILVMFPLELYLDVQIIFNVSPASSSTASSGSDSGAVFALTPFSWAATHHPTVYSWNSAILVQSKGHILPDRYIWLGGGLLVFLLFGCSGKHAWVGKLLGKVSAWRGKGRDLKNVEDGVRRSRSLAATDLSSSSSTNKAHSHKRVSTISTTDTSASGMYLRDL